MNLFIIIIVAVSTFWFFLGAEIKKEHNLVEQKAKAISIAYYYPYFPYFSGIVVGIEQPQKELIDTYYSGKPYIFHLYYQKAVEMFPDNDAAHYLLGFCEYYKGNPDAARLQFEKAVELNPAFFWAYYNLGIIYFQQKDFQKSATVLTKAVALNKQNTLDALHQGFFYGQIWQYIADTFKVVDNNLNEGQEDSLLLLTADFIKAKAYDQALEIIQSIARGNTWHQDIWDDLHQKALSRQSNTESTDRLIQERVTVRIF